MAEFIHTPDFFPVIFQATYRGLKINYDFQTETFTVAFPWQLRNVDIHSKSLKEVVLEIEKLFQEKHPDIGKEVYIRNNQYDRKPVKAILRAVLPNGQALCEMPGSGKLFAPEHVIPNTLINANMLEKEAELDKQREAIREKMFAEMKPIDKELQEIQGKMFKLFYHNQGMPEGTIEEIIEAQ